MPRDPRVQKLERLRAERETRPAGRYHGTHTTAYGNVPARPKAYNVGRTLLSLVVFVVLMAGAVYAAGQYALHGIRPAAAEQRRTVTVDVTPGESLARLATQLQDERLIFNAAIFHWYTRLAGIGGTIQVGRHTLHTGMTMYEVVQALSVPPPTAPTAEVTILPGWRAEQVAAALARHGVARYGDVMREIQRGSFSHAFLADRPAGAGVEGYLMPDTYIFRLGGGARYAIARILDNFGRRVTPADVAQGKKLYGSFYRAAIMASIVERETGTEHDRYLIASVYLNRLHDTTGAFTHLNADPTIQYVVNHAPDWWVPVSRADIARAAASPFNTYTHRGPPPYPIAEPSLASIDAVLHPLHTNFFFFRHINGSHGKSIFCTAQDGPDCETAPQ
jgi:UPF0755 protein